MRSIRLLLAALLLSFVLAPFAIGDDIPAKAQRITHLKSLIELNTIKSKELRLPDHPAQSDYLDLAKARLDLLRESSDYSLELLDLTIEDPAELATRREIVTRRLKSIEDKFSALSARSPK